MTPDSKNWINRLRWAMTSGNVLDFAQGIDDSLVVPSDSQTWGKERQIPGKIIRTLLLKPGLLTPGLIIDPRGLQIRGARIIGNLDLNYARLPCRLIFNRCIFESVPTFEHFFIQGLKISGSVMPGISLSSANISGDLILSGIRSEGLIDAQDLSVGGNLEMTDAVLRNCDGIALNLDGAIVHGGAELSRLIAFGAVQASGLHTNGQLSLENAKLCNPKGNALTLDEAKIGMDASLIGLEAYGEVRALSLQVGGQLGLRDSKLINPGADALSLDRAKIGGYTYLDRNFHSEGQVRAIGLHVAGSLCLERAQLNNPSGDALNLDKAVIESSVNMKQVIATGEIRGHGVHIDGQLSLSSAKLTNLGANALSLDSAIIRGDTLLDNNLEVIGQIRARKSRFVGTLRLTGANFSNIVTDAIDLRHSNIENLVLDGLTITEGRINLAFTEVRLLTTGENKPDTGLPPLSSAQGWTVEAIHGFLQTNRKHVYGWLSTIDSNFTQKNEKFIAQPWHELARTADKSGQPEVARWLRYQAARKITRVAPWRSKLWRGPYGLLVGYGYYPLRVLWSIAALWVVATILCYSCAFAFTPTSRDMLYFSSIDSQGQSQTVRISGATPPPKDYPSFSPYQYALDTAIPAAATGQISSWNIYNNAWLVIVFSILRGFSWVLAALLLAGVTGILRKI